MLSKSFDSSWNRRSPRLEKWGGAECTVNRVQNRFADQLVLTGHHHRPLDFDLLAGLGFDRLRFPILWERVEPRPDQAADWQWTDDRLARLREHGIDPIAGLLHHGSGPAGTSLLDPAFPVRFARFAGRVVERYPQILDWTPINEPLTTARFSALYGLWYPHARDERLFWLALLNQIDGIRLAMRAIREAQPGARLVQTEDLGRTYATPDLAAQAAYDNQRRWLTWDLLCGLVDDDHPMAQRIGAFGFAARLGAIRADPCPPSILGINHYLTSDRLLDGRIERYPPSVRGSNGRMSFADVEAVRALTPPPGGFSAVIRETWARYGRPVALTEVHNGCTREEQARWFEEAWSAAHAARAMGIDVRAVTAWALFGSHGWNTLLTGGGAAETGAFDVSSGAPRETALARAVRRPGAPGVASAGKGWWHREIRLHHPAVLRPAPLAEHGTASRASRRSPPILIAGATGTLGQALAAECRHRDIAHVVTGRERLDLQDRSSIERTLDQVRPWALINAAGWVRVDAAEDSPEACRAVNALGAIALAEACARRGIATLGFSSDLVFDGAASRPYREDAGVAPLNRYGLSKAEMEAGIQALGGTHLIVRTAAFFSPHDEHNFAVQCLRALASGRSFAAAADCVVSPTYVPDLCRAVLNLLIDGEGGIWHLTNGDALSWHAFAHRLAEAAGLSTGRIEATFVGSRAQRPRFAALASARGNPLPPLTDAIARFGVGYNPAGAGEMRRRELIPV